MIIKYLVNLKDWSYFKVEIEKDSIVHLEKCIGEFSDTTKDCLKRWSRQQLNNKSLVEVKDIEERSLFMITPGNSLLDDIGMRQQFV